jgi:hypothetical protein
MSDVPQRTDALPSKCRRTMATERDAVDELFNPSEMPRPRFGASGAVQSIAAGGCREHFVPFAISRRIARVESLSLCGQVAASNFHRIDSERAAARSAVIRQPMTPAACRIL